MQSGATTVRSKARLAAGWTAIAALLLASCGGGGTATGQYSGTSTTTGTQTTMIPYTVNTFDKYAIYFQEMPRVGTGIFARDLNNDEIGALETRKGFVVRFVRDGSPAYHADILPGDIITHINGKPFDVADWLPALIGEAPIRLGVMRRSQLRSVTMIIPAEWRPTRPKE